VLVAAWDMGANSMTRVKKLDVYTSRRVDVVSAPVRRATDHDVHARWPRARAGVERDRTRGDTYLFDTKTMGAGLGGAGVASGTTAK
jgi:hypothetical protein